MGISVLKAQLPRYLPQEVNVSLGPRRLWAYLRDRLGNNPTCWPSQKLIAYELRVCERTIIRWKSELLSVGLLKQRRIKGNGTSRNEYELLLKPEDSSGQLFFRFTFLPVENGPVSPTCHLLSLLSEPKNQMLVPEEYCTGVKEQAHAEASGENQNARTGDRPPDEIPTRNFDGLVGAALPEHRAPDRAVGSGAPGADARGQRELPRIHEQFFGESETAAINRALEYFPQLTHHVDRAAVLAHLARAADSLGLTGHYVAAFLARKGREIERYPQSWPKSPTWFEAALRRYLSGEEPAYFLPAKGTSADARKSNSPADGRVVQNRAAVPVLPCGGPMPPPGDRRGHSGLESVAGCDFLRVWAGEEASETGGDRCQRAA